MEEVDLILLKLKVEEEVVVLTPLPPPLVPIASPSIRLPNVLSPAQPLIANNVNVSVLRLAWV
jgi:hypothetical protein